MHIEVKTAEFQKVLEIVCRVSTKHVTLPVLQCLYIEAKENTISISATNLEIGITTSLSGTVHASGEVSVPAHTLQRLVSLYTQNKITFCLEDGVLVVKSGNGETSIKTIAHDEFPTIPQLDGVGKRVNRGTFTLGLKSVSFAASLSSIKPELGSVYIYQKKEDTLTFVATDSFRLMEKTVAQSNVTLDESILIPQKNAVEITQIFDRCDGDPELLLNENQCAFRFENGLYLTTRLTSGSFPDYEQIIPKEYSTTATLLKDDLVHAFRKSDIFLNKFSQVRLHISDNSIHITAESGETGMTTESIQASVDGEELSLSFNQRYLTDALSHFVDDSVILSCAGVGRPMVITGVGDGSIRYLVMPMNK